MKETFDETTKHYFTNADEPCYIKLRTRKKDEKYDIKAGRLTLNGKEVAPLFDPAVEAILEAVEQQRKVSSKSVSFIFLVGGFSANNYLFRKLQASLASTGVCLSRPDGHNNKAVADGAVSFFIDHLVSSRAAGFTYGVEACTPYFPCDPEHRKRACKKFKNVDGRFYLGEAFSSILMKGDRVSETQEFEHKYSYIGMDPAVMQELEVEIIAYRGIDTDPRWLDEDEENCAFSTLCTIRADLSAVPATENSQADGSEVYYSIKYSVVLLFGLTELKAQLSWSEMGTEKRSEATIVYDDKLEELE